MLILLTLTSDIHERSDSIEGMNFTRFGLLCLAALLTTAMWAGLLYGGSLLVGIPIEPLLLAKILGGIFVLMLLGLALFATSGSEEPQDTERSKDTER
jgi:hypothetical protein